MHIHQTQMRRCCLPASGCLHLVSKKSDHSRSLRQAVNLSGLIWSPQIKQWVYFRLSCGVSTLLSLPRQKVWEIHHTCPVAIMQFLSQSHDMGWFAGRGEASLFPDLHIQAIHLPLILVVFWKLHWLRCRIKLRICLLSGICLRLKAL